jgi:hypothetical protein
VRFFDVHLHMRPGVQRAPVFRAPSLSRPWFASLGHAQLRRANAGSRLIVRARTRGRLCIRLNFLPVRTGAGAYVDGNALQLGAALWIFDLDDRQIGADEIWPGLIKRNETRHL